MTETQPIKRSYKAKQVGNYLRIPNEWSFHDNGIYYGVARGSQIELAKKLKIGLWIYEINEPHISPVIVPYDQIDDLCRIVRREQRVIAGKTDVFYLHLYFKKIR